MRVRAERGLRRRTCVASSEPSSPLRAIEPETFKDYDFRLFDSLAEMRDEIHAPGCRSRTRSPGRWIRVGVEDEEATSPRGTSNSMECSSAGTATQVDWIASPGSLARGRLDPHGAGLRPQLRRRDHRCRPPVRAGPRGSSSIVTRTSTRRARRTIRSSGSSYSDDDLLTFIANIYAVLLTRGILGTYLYVVDPGLREYLRSVNSHSLTPRSGASRPARTALPSSHHDDWGNRV